LEFNVPFQHKYGYIRDEKLLGQQGSNNAAFLLHSIRTLTDVGYIRISYSSSSSYTALRRCRQWSHLRTESWDLLINVRRQRQPVIISIINQKRPPFRAPIIVRPALSPYNPPAVMYTDHRHFIAERNPCDIYMRLTNTTPCSLFSHLIPGWIPSYRRRKRIEL